MKRLVFDLDGTLALYDPERTYEAREPNLPLIDKLRRYKADGFEIIICSARNMRTFQGQIGRINAETLPAIIDWLNRHEVPFDEIHIGKPWCGTDGFYVDDRAIRPSEFVALSLAEIHARLAAEH
jgi:capsule biosynthesis phosphatase